MSSPALRLGLVGCGRLAEHGYAPAAARSDAVRIVAVADPVRARRELVAGLVAGLAGTGAAVASCTDARELVARADVDAVIVASPVAAHLADARAATDAKLPVLVEKPPAPDAATASQLADLSPLPWVGFNRRFDPGARRVRDAVVAAGPIELELEIAYRRKSWRACSVRDDALLDLGPHLVDWAAWISASDVIGVEHAAVAPDRASCTLVLGRGRARIVAACDRSHREVITVRDAVGALVERHSSGGPLALVRARLSSGPHPLVLSLGAQLDAFARAVHGTDAPGLATARDAHGVMGVIDAIRESAARGGRSVPVVSAPGG